MMAITTSNSIRVNALRLRGTADMRHLSHEATRSSEASSSITYTGKRCERLHEGPERQIALACAALVGMSRLPAARVDGRRRRQPPLLLPRENRSQSTSVDATDRGNVPPANSRPLTPDS